MCDRFLLCRLGWPQVWDPPASASWWLGIQVCVAMPRSGFILRFLARQDGFGGEHKIISKMILPAHTQINLNQHFSCAL